MVGCLLTVHPAANGDLVKTLGRQRQQGKELATLPQKADGSGQVSSLTGTPNIWIIYGTYLNLSDEYALKILIATNPDVVEFSTMTSKSLAYLVIFGCYGIICQNQFCCQLLCDFRLDYWWNLGSI